MLKASVYLNFNGTTEEAFAFYKSVFGGDFIGIQRFRDIPNAPPMPEEVLDKIMHIALPIGENLVLMATDALEAMGQKLTVGNNVHISLHPDSQDEAQRLFAALSAGGKVEMALQETFWGALYGSFSDKFGVHWMINYDLPKAA